ncbi:uncharacterized protein [Venturia canescens]|uniref:uncharacterized protein n=1 Tax=Venturia canescens TaxID=32260 RepID=UPI001C9CFA5A|nr:uncharacterized protein LOC122414539 [Venturia canescens]
MTVTSNGFVLVWDALNQDGKPTTNGVKKGFVKSVPLQKANLTCIEKHEEVIVIGNNSGRLYFYDNQLRLLYWCKDCDFDSIVSISFDRESSFKRPENPPSESSISQSRSIDEILGTTDEEEISESSKSEIEIEHEKQRETSHTESDKIRVFSQNIDSKETRDKTIQSFISSAITIDIDYRTANSTKGKFLEPSDCTIDAASFAVPIFFVSSSSGKIGRLDIAKLKCRFVADPVAGAITAIAVRPQSDYVVTGDTLGILSLYKYTTRSRMVTKKTPAVPNLKKLLRVEEGKLDTTYVTRPQIHESLVGVSTLKFSPTKDGILACGLKSGLVWILHPDTLDPLDPNPFKHSSSSITDIIFTNNGEYLAYSDDLFTVGVFRKNVTASPMDKNQWNFLGKYHSHCSPIREILFLKPAVGKISPRLLSIGEDRNLVEYDLEKR